MRMLRLSMFLCGAMVAVPALAQPYPVSNPQVAAEGDVINDSSALDDGNIEYIEPIFGVVQPSPFFIEWAPPALIVEDVGLAPGDDAFWVGGYWDWYDSQWCWARGRWVVAPQAGYVWNSPYYENRGGRVVYVAGFWRANDRPFSRPVNVPPLARSNPRWKHGPRPVGATGIFVPAPPGSRPGVIVSAPMGTPPRVVASQPPIMKAGMAVRAGEGGRYEVHAPAGVVRGGQKVDAKVAAMPARAGEKGAREKLAETSKAPPRTPSKAAAPNLDPTRAAARTVEHEPVVAPKPANESRIQHEVPRTPSERGVTAMPQREAPLRPEGPRSTAPVQRAPVERAPVERAPMGPVERGPVERGPVERGPVERGPVERGPVERGPVGRGPAAAPVAAPAARPMAAPAAAPAAGGELHHH